MRPLRGVLGRGCTWTVLLCFALQLLLPPGLLADAPPPPTPKVTLFIPGEAPSTESVGASSSTTSAAQATFDRMKALLSSLALTVASSPLLMRALTHQLGRIKNTRMRQWVRESYFVADQVMAEARRTGLVDNAKLDKSRLVHQEMGKMLQQAGWLERLAMGKELKDGKALVEAEQLSEQFARKTFYGEVAELRADQRIAPALADELLRIQGQAVLTPRQLAADLLRKTELSPREIRELARTYESKQTLRVEGTRESRYDASILNKVEPWRDGGSRTARSSYLSREAGADLLLFEGSPEDYTRQITEKGRLNGEDASRLVDEYVSELKKEAAFRRDLQQRTVQGNEAPKAPQAKETVAGDGGDEFKAQRRYQGEKIPLEAGTSRAELQGILSKVKSSSGVHGSFVERFSTPIDVVETREVYIRNTGSRIEVSSTLLNGVVAKSGEKGMAFLLGHELAHQTLQKSGASLAPAALELEADRLGYDWARKAYPELDGQTVKSVLESFPVRDGTVANRVGELRASLDPTAHHPIDGERLYRLAEANGFAADRGFPSAPTRSAFQADASLGARLRSLGGGLRGTAALGRAVDSFRYDFVRGGLLVDVGVSAAMRLIGRWQAGEGVKASFGAVTDELLSSEFLIGDLLGGTLGAAIGSMISIPGTAALGGFLGASVGMFPTVLCTMVFAQAGYSAIRLMKEGRFSVKALFGELPLATLLSQSFGAVLGMAAGSILIPGPVGAILGGIVGGSLAAKLVGVVSASADRAAAPSSAEGLPAAPGLVSSDPLLQGIDLQHPDAADLAALDGALRSAYGEYLQAAERHDMSRSAALFRRYLAIQSQFQAARRIAR